jgi:hypothetical protein
MQTLDSRNQYSEQFSYSEPRSILSVDRAISTMETLRAAAMPLRGPISPFRIN